MLYTGGCDTCIMINTGGCDTCTGGYVIHDI